MNYYGEMDVFEQRKILLSDIKEKVDKAFINRLIVNLSPDGREDEAFIEEIRSLGKKIRPLHGNRSYYILPSRDKPHEVTIANSHFFKYLIQLAAEQIAGYSGYTQEWIRESVTEILKHEHQHHVPVLGQKGLNVGYKISFLEDIDSGKVGFQTFTVLSGNTRVAIIRQFFGAPRNKSRSDEVFFE